MTDEEIIRLVREAESAIGSARRATEAVVRALPSKTSRQVLDRNVASATQQALSAAGEAFVIHTLNRNREV